MKLLKKTTDKETAICAARENRATLFTKAAQSTIDKVKVPAGAPDSALGFAKVSTWRVARFFARAYYQKRGIIALRFSA
jgi:hypothetical protein